MWLARVDSPATTHGCRVSWLEGTLAGEYRIGRPAYVSSAALVVVLRQCMPTQMPLTLTRAERGTVSAAAKAEDRQTDTHWRHPQGELQQEQLDLLHAALARARYDRRLAQTPVQLGAGQWCRGIDADAAAIMAVLTVRGGRGGLLCTVMLWERAQAGLRPTGRTTTVSSRRLRRLTVIDSRTGDVASAASAHGPSLLVQMDGVARLRMATCLARYDVATGRSWRANEPGLIVPVRQTAAAAGLTAADAQAGVVRASAAKWPPTTSRYWWTQATAAYTRAKFGHRVKLCRCCQARGLVAPLTPMHVGAECPEWNALWAWATTTLRKAGAALPAEVTRAQWLMFGHGAARGAKAVVADQIWGAALGAINGLTYGLVKDGVEFMPVAAVRMARSTVVQAAAADLARTRCGGAALTRAAWAARWSGLARLRRDATRFATGYEIVDGW